MDHIPEGNVIFIRFLRSDRKLDVFGEKFEVSKELVYCCLKAIIDTGHHAFKVHLDDDLVQAFEYRMTSDGRVSLHRWVNDVLTLVTS
jgi:hypothetical protein